MATKTAKLGISLIQPSDLVSANSLNKPINDIDGLVLGLDHLKTALHWEEWEDNKIYLPGDVVRWKAMNSGQYARCTKTGTSDITEPLVNVTGTSVNDGTVTWMIDSLGVGGGAASFGLWAAGIEYSRGDFCVYDLCLYRCITRHTSSSNFRTDETKWQEIKASVRMWHPSIYYYQDDVVVNDKKLYICTTAHTSASTFTPAEEANWEILSGGGSGGITDWSVNTPYEKGQVVRHQNILYLCMSNHTSSGTDISADITNWVLLYGQLNAWESGVYYPQRATVMHNQGNGHKVYTCNVAHTSTSFATDALQKWSVIASNITVWQKDTFYDKGEVVLHEGILYHCNTFHVSDWSSFVTDFTTNNYWETISNHQFSYKKDTFYAKDSIVEYKGKLYKALKDLKGQSGFDYLHWQQVSRTLEEWKPFVDNTDYIALINFEPDQYNLLFEGSGLGIAFEDVTQTVQFSTYAGFRDTRLSTHTPGYLGGYSAIQDLSNFVSASLRTYFTSFYQTTDFTFDCVFNSRFNTSVGITFMGCDVYLSSITVNTWYHLACVYDATSNAVDYWLDGVYQGNIPVSFPNQPVSDNSRLDLHSSIYYDNLRFRKGKIYTANTNFNIPTDKAEFDLSTFRNYSYEIGDFVSYQGAIYKCIEEDADTVFDVTKWELVADKVVNWTTNTYYHQNRLVVYNGIVYLCNTSHTSTQWSADTVNWTSLGSGSGGTGGAALAAWASNTSYVAGDTVYCEDEIFICVTSHTSGTTFSADGVKWKRTRAAMPLWQPNTYYDIDDFINYGDCTYRCITAHVSSGTTFLDDAFTAPDSMINWISVTRILSPTSSMVMPLQLNQIICPMQKELFYCTTNFTNSANYLPFIKDNVAPVKNYYNEFMSNICYYANAVVLYNDNYYVVKKDIDTSVHVNLVEFEKLNYGLETWKPPIPFGTFGYFTFEPETMPNYSQTYSTQTGTWPDGIGNVLIHINQPISGTPTQVTTRQGITLLQIASGYTVSFSIDMNKMSNLTSFSVFFRVYVTKGVTSHIFAFGQDFDFTSKITNSGWWGVFFNYNYASKSASCYFVDGSTSQLLSIVGTKNNVTNKNFVLYSGVEYVSVYFSANLIDITRPVIALLNTYKYSVHDYREHTRYKVNDYVIYQGNLYRCDVEDTSDMLFNESKGWFLVFGCNQPVVIPNWAANTYYNQNTLVVSGNNMYRCITYHTSGTDFAADLTANKWVCVDGGSSASTGNFATKAEALTL